MSIPIVKAFLTRNFQSRQKLPACDQLV